MAKKESNKMQNIVIVVIVLVVLGILSVVAVAMHQSSKTSDTEMTGNSQTVGNNPSNATGTAGSSVMVQPTVAPQTNQPLPTPPASLDAGEQDVNTKLNSLDNDATGINQGINETPVDLSQ